MSKRTVCLVVKNRLSNDARVKKEIAVLVKDGWQVTVIAMPEQNKPEKETVNGVTIIRPPLFSSTKTKLRSQIVEASSESKLSLKAKVIRLLRKNKIRRIFADLARDIPWENKLRKAAIETSADIYHANDLDTLQICGIAAKRNNSKLVYDSHELWLESSRYFIATHPLNKIRLKKIEQKYIKIANEVIAVTPLRGKKMKEMYPSLTNLTIVENAPEVLSTLPKKGLLRSRINATTDTVIALYQGVFCPERGLEELLEAARLITNPKIKFVFIGMDAWNGTLQRKAAEMNITDRVIFLPPVPSEELPNTTVDADMGFILFRNTCLNHYYSLPNKLYEYQMAGIPIISSNFPELTRVLTAVKSGLTVDPESVKEIVLAIEKLAQNRELREQMGSNGRTAAVSKYNWEPQSILLRDLYRRLR